MDYENPTHREMMDLEGLKPMLSQNHRLAGGGSVDADKVQAG